VNAHDAAVLRPDAFHNAVFSRYPSVAKYEFIPCERLPSCSSVPFNQVLAPRFHAGINNRLIARDVRHSPSQTASDYKIVCPGFDYRRVNVNSLNLRCVVLNFPAAFQYVSPTNRERVIGAHGKDGGGREVEQLFLNADMRNTHCMTVVI